MRSLQYHLFLVNMLHHHFGTSYSDQGLINDMYTHWDLGSCICLFAEAIGQRDMEAIDAFSMLSKIRETYECGALEKFASCGSFLEASRIYIHDATFFTDMLRSLVFQSAL